jgi:hypothetical protein
MASMSPAVTLRAGFKGDLGRTLGRSARRQQSEDTFFGRRRSGLPILRTGASLDSNSPRTEFPFPGQPIPPCSMQINELQRERSSFFRKTRAPSASRLPERPCQSFRDKKVYVAVHAGFVRSSRAQTSLI